MGCICSKESTDNVVNNEPKKQHEFSKTSMHVFATTHGDEAKAGVVYPDTQGSVRSEHKPSSEANLIPGNSAKIEGNGSTRIIERPKSSHHQRRSTLDMAINGAQPSVSKIVSMPHGVKGEQVAAGWPTWLSSVAGEAIKGWVPRSAESFEKLNKIGQGTYSSVYRARDLTNNKIVAMKKVRFVNMDPESVRFMAREIAILRRLDHPNVMKLEAIVTSRISGSLYLVFDYMEHDLAGLAASHGAKFTESQIKCYMQQFLRGLEHCHARGVLHRDIKGSNLLLDNEGVLKIGDFGLATLFEPHQQNPLTSRVVTLWYRAPELLLGATEYGVAIDMWSTGCILAELFTGKPIMPGRTEVEQMHKIFKLCGSPPEEYWRKTKLPHATSFKPHRPYKRCIADTFKDFPPSALQLVDMLLSMEPEKRGTAASALNSEFFTTKPLPCDSSSLPKYSPSKELDVKLRDEEARRRKAETVKGRGSEAARKSSKPTKEAISPDHKAEGHGPSNKSISVKYNPQEDSGTGFPIEPHRGNSRGSFSHSNSVIHPSATGNTWRNKQRDDDGRTIPEWAFGSSRHTRQGSHQLRADDFSRIQSNGEERRSGGENLEYVPKRNRILCSGPLLQPGGNMDDMLKEHERQIQEAVRKARLDKAKSKINFC